jgi:hypothetical protein
MTESQRRRGRARRRPSPNPIPTPAASLCLPSSFSPPPARPVAAPGTLFLLVRKLLPKILDNSTEIRYHFVRGIAAAGPRARGPARGCRRHYLHVNKRIVVLFWRKLFPPISSIAPSRRPPGADAAYPPGRYCFGKNLTFKYHQIRPRGGRPAPAPPHPRRRYCSGKNFYYKYHLQLSRRPAVSKCLGPGPGPAIFKVFASCTR